MRKSWILCPCKDNSSHLKKTTVFFLGVRLHVFSKIFRMLFLYSYRSSVCKGFDGFTGVQLNLNVCRLGVKEFFL